MGTPRYLKFELKARKRDTSVFELFYSSATPNDEYKVVDPVLELEEGASGSLTFSIPKTNKLYGEMQMMMTTIRAYIDDEIVWEGRPIKMEEDMWLNHKVTCEGALSYFNDVYQPAAKYTNTSGATFLSRVISSYNSKAHSDRRIILGTFEGDNKSFTALDDFETQYESTFNVIMSICESYGSIPLIVRDDGVLKLKLIKKSGRLGETSTQFIEFGKNLIDYAKNYDFSSMVTAVLPIGKKVESSTSGSIVQGNVKSPIATHTGYILSRTYPAGNPPAQPYIEITSSSMADFVDGGYITQTVADYTLAHKSKYVVYEYEVSPEDYVFVSTRMDNGWGMTVWRASASSTYYYDNTSAKNSAVFTTKSNVKMQAPSSLTGNGRLYVACYVDGDYSGYSVTEGVPKDEYDDEYVNITDISEGVTTIINDRGEKKTEYAEVYTESGSAYAIDRDRMDTYGWIEQKIEFSEEENPSQLFLNAQKYLTADRFDGMQIEVTAMDLRALGYYDATNLQVSELIRVYAPVYGLVGDGTGILMPITKLSIPFNKPEDMKYTIGYSADTQLTTMNSNSNTKILEKIEKQMSFSETVEAAKNNAVMSIKDCNKSYITIEYDNTTNKAQSIIISDTSNYLNSQNGYWMWNYEGLAWIPHGSSQGVVAMTNEGEIYADLITAGTMAADRILGGTLRLGYWNGVNGEISMKDSNGNVIMTVDKDNGIRTSDISTNFHTQLKGGELKFWNQYTGTGFEPTISNVVLNWDGANHYRNLLLYGERIAFNCGNFWIFSNGEWYATDSGVRNVDVDGKRLTFVNGILKEVTTL